MKAVFKRELSALFSGITGWLIAAALPFVTGIVLMISSSGTLRFCDLMAYSWPAMLLTGIIYSAGCFAADRRSGAVRAWRMLPISETNIVLGRYLAMCVPFLAGAAVTALYMIVVTVMGGSAIAASVISVLMAALCGCAVTALAMWISCMSGSAVLNSLVMLAVTALCVFHAEISAFVVTYSPQAILFIGVALLAMLCAYVMTRNFIVALIAALAAELVAMLFFKGDTAASEAAVKAVFGAFRLFDPLGDMRYGMFMTGDILMYVSVVFVSLFGCVQCRKACGRRAL